MDCFVAEFIIGPAEGGTRWLLAMTVFDPTPLATTRKSRGEIARACLQTAGLFEIRIYERSILCVVPANAGTHNHHRLLEQKPAATARNREAAAYGSPLPVRNCALGGDDVGRLRVARPVASL